MHPLVQLAGVAVHLRHRLLRACASLSGVNAATVWATIDCVITSSPTRLIRRSTFSTGTRMLAASAGPAVGVVLIARFPSWGAALGASVRSSTGGGGASLASASIGIAFDGQRASLGDEFQAGIEVGPGPGRQEPDPPAEVAVLRVHLLQGRQRVGEGRHLQDLAEPRHVPDDLERVEPGASTSAAGRSSIS